MNIKSFKVKSRNVKPAPEQLAAYSKGRGSMHVRSTNLRFGKLAVLSDQDLDG